MPLLPASAAFSMSSWMLSPRPSICALHISMSIGRFDARHDAVRLIRVTRRQAALYGLPPKEVVEEEHTARAVELFDGFLILFDDIVRPLARNERHRANVLLLSADHLTRAHEFPSRKGHAYRL